MAKQRSDLIDEQIKRERAAQIQAQAVQRKILLLGASHYVDLYLNDTQIVRPRNLTGQAESGKTTTLKQFQLLQSKSAFSAQLNSYRALIYLNVLNSVRRILDAVALPDDTDQFLSDSSSSSSHSSFTQRRYPAHLTELAVRLRPLLHIQNLLERQFQGPTDPEVVHASSRRSRRAGSSASSGDDQQPEVTVHAWSSWSERFAPGVRSNPSSSADSICMDWNSRDDPGRIFAACADDLMALWEDQTVQNALAKQRPSIRESPGL
jgi:hypothetical protein